jgi:plasmid stabilization system protein ParE
VKKPYVLTPRAEQDIGDIWDYIAADSIAAADRVLAALEQAIYRLAQTAVSVICAKTWLIAGIGSSWSTRI